MYNITSHFHEGQEIISVIYVYKEKRKCSLETSPFPSFLLYPTIAILKVIPIHIFALGLGSLQRARIKGSLIAKEYSIKQGSLHGSLF
jgi:hypothetical protein